MELKTAKVPATFRKANAFKASQLHALPWLPMLPALLRMEQYLRATQSWFELAPVDARRDRTRASADMRGNRLGRFAIPVLSA
jgi:hypothetical protein